VASFSVSLSCSTSSPSWTCTGVQPNNGPNCSVSFLYSPLLFIFYAHIFPAARRSQTIWNWAQEYDFALQKHTETYITSDRNAEYEDNKLCHKHHDCNLIYSEYTQNINNVNLQVYWENSNRSLTTLKDTDTQRFTNIVKNTRDFRLSARCN
jgi:hypothetical protein